MSTPSMDIGIFTHSDDIDDLVAQAQSISADGFSTMWCPQIFGTDTITTLAVVAREVPDLHLGTAVVPTYPRHPAMLAAQAKTVSSISGGRFTLGIGLSHQIVVESMFGMSYDKPVRHMREYLDILMPLLANEAVSAQGDTLAFNGALSFEAPATPVLIAALGPAMLKLAGSRADGTATWMTGPKTIGDHTAPSIRAAAEAAGRPAPQVVAAVPVVVTEDVADARERTAKEFEMYGMLPSYRAMMDREGVDGPGDVAIIGDADVVAEGIAAFGDAGATMFVAVTSGNRAEREATRDVLKDLNGG